jgi:bacteriocin biosynthesis cyclodehydratase domain-containing protein
MSEPGSLFLKLRRTVTILRRRDGSIQLGWDPESALLLRPPAGADGAALTALLHRLYDGMTFDEVVDATGPIGVRRRDIAAIVGELDEHGLLERRTAQTRPCSVRVHGRGPLSDLLWAGLRRLGRTSVRARSRLPSPDVAGWSDDLVVLADDVVVDPRLVEDLHIAGLAHMPVRIRDGRGVVGPLVVPGRTSCLRCADLLRRDYDDEWPYLAAQLLGRVGYARPAALTATAALALDQVDAATSGSPRRRAAVVNATLELDLDSHRIARRRWPRHSECDCAGSPLSERCEWLVPSEVT